MAAGPAQAMPPSYSSSDSSDYDSEEERAAVRRRAASSTAAAAAQRRAQAHLLHAFQARRAARDQLELEALSAKLRQQCGLGGGAWEGSEVGAADRWRPHGGSDRGRTWARALQQHEGQWAALEASCAAAGARAASSAGSGCALGYADVPWPPLGCREYLLGLAAWQGQRGQQQGQGQLQGQGQQQKKQPSGEQAALRRAYAHACLRWHPDKFEGRWGWALAPADRDRVLARVRQLIQGLNQAWGDLQQEQPPGDAAAAAGWG